MEEISLNTSSNIVMVLVGNKIDRRDEWGNQSQRQRRGGADFR